MVDKHPVVALAIDSSMLGYRNFVRFFHYLIPTSPMGLIEDLKYLVMPRGGVSILDALSTNFVRI